MKLLLVVPCLVAVVAASGHLPTMGQNYMYNNMMNGGWNMGNNWMGGQNMNHGGGSAINQLEIMRQLQQVLSYMQHIAENRHDDDDGHRGDMGGNLGNLLGRLPTGGNHGDVLSMIIGLLMGSSDGHQGGNQGHSQGQGGHGDGQMDQLQQLVAMLQMGDLNRLVLSQLVPQLSKLMEMHEEYMEAKSHFKLASKSLCLMVRAKAYMEMDNSDSMIMELSEEGLKGIASKMKEFFEMDSGMEQIEMLQAMNETTFDKKFFDVASFACKSNWGYIQMRRKVDKMNNIHEEDEEDEEKWEMFKEWMEKLVKANFIQNYLEHHMGGEDAGMGNNGGDATTTTP